MNNLPHNTEFLVLERTGLNGYKLWYRTKGEGLVTTTSEVPLKVGGWFVRDDVGLTPLLSQPFNTCVMCRENLQMIRVSTVIVRPVPSFFDTDEGQLKRKCMKYLGVSCDFGTVFVTKKLLEQMEHGVPYAMLIASFGICHSPEDERTLKAMKVMGTIWIATKQQLVPARIPDGKQFIERMRNEGVELLDFPQSADLSSPVEDSVCRPGTSSSPRNENTSTSVSNETVPSPNGVVPNEIHSELQTTVSEDVHPVNESSADAVWSEESPPEACSEQPKNKPRVDYNSEEGKARTRACLEKVLNNLRICNAFTDAGYAEQLAALRAIMLPADR